MSEHAFQPPPLVTKDGVTWGSAPGAGEISVGKYEGPEAEASAPWKCPACGQQNEAPLKFGCVHCHAGEPGRHIGNPPSAARTFEIDVTKSYTEGLAAVNPDADLQAVAYEWAQANEPGAVGPAASAFVAGYKLARAQFLAHTMQAAPMTVDVAQLAPHTKAQRTIIAALTVFRDSVLSQTPDEIATGEWMGITEVDVLIATLQAQL